MYDFLRFVPDANIDFGFENYVVFAESKIKVNKFYKARLIKAESVNELISKLKRVRNDEIVGVYSNNLKVNREAVMRKKVDVLLDGVDRKLDYKTIKLAAEKNVIIEICFSKYVKANNLMRLFEEDLELIRIINKFDTPFALTSAASNCYEMRTKKQIYDFFSFLGANIKSAEKHAIKLIREYYDPNFILDGLEILE